MELTIKSATIENLKDIQDLNLMLFKKEYEEYDKTLNCEWTFGVDGEDYFRKRISEEDGCALIAVINDKVIGYLVGGLNEEDSYRTLPIFAELENMFILDEYRGKGLGSKLYQAFVDWCKLKGVGRLKVVASVKNMEGINFYRKNGFKDYDLILEKDM